MIEVKQLCKSFDGCRALCGLDITVPDASVYGLVGPNGAGKSTLINHLAGILRQDSGEVLIDSQPVYENPAVKRRVAYIPDEIFYYPQATIDDMARFYRSVYPTFSTEKFKSLAPAFELDTNRVMRKLSKGMQKQAAFWIALSCRPDYFILDEPVDGLDPVMRRQVMSLILAEVAERNTTVLISSHNLRELEDVCDHVGIMNHGKMLLERSLADMQGNTVKLQMVGDVPEGLEILHQSSTGRLQTLVVRGNAREVEAQVAANDPMFYDILPLSLEEIFIYELGGVNHEINSIIL